MSLFNQFMPTPTRPFAGRDQNGNGAASAAAPVAGAAAPDADYTVKPAYEIDETPEAWSLSVQLPGVARENLEFTAEENLITIRGPRAWRQPEAWTALYRESGDAPYQLVLEHGNNVAVEKIHAELRDGVLRVTLPKTEAVKPRKIGVN